MSRHLMLVPSLACPASCAYCFGPHAGGPSMRQETVEAVVRWQNALGDKDSLEVTFHGGEPLVPGIQFCRMALPLLRDGLAPLRVRFAMQSNLWLLTDELCDLFHEYSVSLSTSLDGPKPINDAQRGQGYFSRTMAGIERARTHGLDVGCICTFTAQSAPHVEKIWISLSARDWAFPSTRRCQLSLVPVPHSIVILRPAGPKNLCHARQRPFAASRLRVTHP